MMMYAILAADLLHSNDMITNEQHSLLTGGSCGKISPTWRSSFNAASADDLAPVEAVLKVPSHTVALEAAPPVAVNFQIDETKFVRVSGVYAKNGSYVTAKLIEVVDGKETVKIVHTVPRLFSARGVYAFPLVDENEFVSLTILNR
jgi:hypothetical protein